MTIPYRDILRRADSDRPLGYLAEMLAAGEKRDDDFLIEDARFHELLKKYHEAVPERPCC